MLHKMVVLPLFDVVHSNHDHAAANTRNLAQRSTRCQQSYQDSQLLNSATSLNTEVVANPVGSFDTCHKTSSCRSTDCVSLQIRLDGINSHKHTIHDRSARLRPVVSRVEMMSLMSTCSLADTIVVIDQEIVTSSLFSPFFKHIAFFGDISATHLQSTSSFPVSYLQTCLYTSMLPVCSSKSTICTQHPSSL